MHWRGLGFALLAALIAAAPYGAETAQLAPPYAPDYVDELFAAIAQARGMPDLRQTTLPPSYREIRITDQLSSVCCWPTPMLRLVAHDGQSEGELLLYRRLYLGPGNPDVQRADERCAPFRDEQICVRTWAKLTDWRSVARMLNELGAWEIADRCEFVKGVNGISASSHQGDLYIQRLIGSRLSAYRCNAPRARTTTEAGRKANGIYQYFLQVAGPVPAD